MAAPGLRPASLPDGTSDRARTGHIAERRVHDHPCLIVGAGPLARIRGLVSRGPPPLAAAASPLPPGGSPASRRLPRAVSPHPAAGGTGRSRRVTAPARADRPSSSRQQSCRRAKITVKGARYACVSDVSDQGRVLKAPTRLSTRANRARRQLVCRRWRPAEPDKSGHGAGDMRQRPPCQSAGSLNFVALRLRRRYAPPLSVIFPGKFSRLSGGRASFFGCLRLTLT